MAIGGAGGNNGHFHGGLGARIITDLEVTEGKTLYINVRPRVPIHTDKGLPIQNGSVTGWCER